MPHFGVLNQVYQWWEFDKHVYSRPKCFSTLCARFQRGTVQPFALTVSRISRMRMRFSRIEVSFGNPNWHSVSNSSLYVIFIFFLLCIQYTNIMLYQGPYFYYVSTFFTHNISKMGQKSANLCMDCFIPGRCSYWDFLKVIGYRKFLKIIVIPFEHLQKLNRF